MSRSSSFSTVSRGFFGSETNTWSCFFIITIIIIIIIIIITITIIITIILLVISTLYLQLTEEQVRH